MSWRTGAGLPINLFTGQRTDGTADTASRGATNGFNWSLDNGGGQAGQSIAAMFA
jgi:hypothetical protein